MADLVALIKQVRRRGRDPLPSDPTNLLYDDSYYEDAISFALKKLNFDFKPTVAWTIASIPSVKEFLLIKLATIEMCYVRMLEATDADETGKDVTSIAVPDLSVSASSETGVGANESFTELADRLEDEYNRELDKGEGGNTVPTVQVGEFSRFSLRTGTRSPRAIATPPPQCELLTAEYDAGTLSLTWTPLRFSEFSRYEIVARQDGVLNSEEVLYSEWDNHVKEYSASASLAVGTWLIRIDVYNVTELVTEGNELEVEVI